MTYSIYIILYIYIVWATLLCLYFLVRYTDDIVIDTIYMCVSIYTNIYTYIAIDYNTIM